MKTQRTIPLLFIIPLLLSNLILPPVSPATSVTAVIAPNSLTTTQGSKSGVVAALATQDQSGTADNPSAYVLFKTPAKAYIGYRTFKLPLDIRPKQISSAVLQVNFKGPAATQQIWSWSIYNWNTQRWVKLGNSVGTTAGSWNTLSIPISNIATYISSSKIRIRIRSNNASSNAKLDYETLSITYEPVTPTPTRTATSTPTCAAHDNAFECQVLSLINAERAKAGLSPLVSNALLHKAARAHSNDMAGNNFFSHTGSNGSSFSQRITAAGYSWSAAAENIAAGQPGPANVVEGWMDSSGHKANILNPNYVHIGIGYVYDTNDGLKYYHYWTTDFGKPR